jgi:hypothetical protein
MAKIEESSATTATTVTTPEAGGQNPQSSSGNKSGNGRKGPGKPRGAAKTAPFAPKPKPTPPAGSEKTGATPTPFSGTPSFSAWGPAPVQQSKVRIRQTVYIDAAGYEDLVDIEYRQLTAKHNASARKLPRSLFRYLAFTAWWHRAFHLKLANSNRVSQQEREAMRVLESLVPNLSLPTRILEYLKNMGNFDHIDGQRIEILIPDFDLSEGLGGNDQRGFVRFQLPNNSRRPTPGQSFIYGRYPIPGIYAMQICREYRNTYNSNPTIDPQAVAPAATDFGKDSDHVVPTDNIIGYDSDPLEPLHSSWNQTLADLGWNEGTITDLAMPMDTLSNWLLSPSTLRWISDSLKQISNYPLRNWSDINSSIGGAYLQLSYLREHQLQNVIPTVQQMTTWKSTMLSETVLHSSKPIATTHLGPALACAYRKYILFRVIDGVANTTLGAPWIPKYDHGGLHSFPVPATVDANAEWNHPGPVYNVSSYVTHQSTRALALNAIML